MSKVLGAALAALLMSLVGVGGVANAALPMDYWMWSGEDVRPGSVGHFGWASTGGGDYQQLDECDSGVPMMCDLLTEETPIVLAEKTGTYPNGSSATWTYTVPGGPDTYIKSGGMVAVNITGESELLNEVGEPTAFVGIRDASGWVEYDETDEMASIEAMSAAGEPGDRQIQIGMKALSTPSMSYDHWVAPFAQVVELGDDVAPEQDLDVDQFDGIWVDESPLDIPVSAEDNGLGIKDVAAVGPKRNPAGPLDMYATTDQLGCEGNSDDPCPLVSPSGTKVTVDPSQLKEGHTFVSVGARDAAENVADSVNGYDVDLSIDTKEPAVTLGGSFTTAPGMVLDGPSYDLEVDAEDGDAVVANSGVVKIQVLIDNVEIDSDTQSCPVENCGMELDPEILPDNYANGPHQLKAKVTDAVGHVKTTTVDFEVDR
ncbi:MAG: hypothetical protein J0H98_09325 [Solirubrobacterales bacterium]|nr:hypothetical protein [Solirubrobacterales bacterium]